MTTTTGRISVEYFLDAINADRAVSNLGGLSDEMCEAGLRLWDDTVEAIPQVAGAGQLCIASSAYCSELDLPQGSTFSECLAAALDIHPQFNGSDRLVMLQELMKEHGLIEPVPFEA